MNNFKKLGVSNVLVEALDSMRISIPTPIQESSIPHIYNDKDLIGEAQTGTGKTLAFLLPMFDKISASKSHIQGLILTPTRELALQITEEAKKLAVSKNINILSAYGGKDINSQLKKLKKQTHLVIATPGRLLDHIQRKTIDLSKLSTLVLDEADQMLLMGFQNEVRSIISCTPKKRQTLCFSATLNSAVKKLAYKNMMDPVVVSIESESKILQNIDQKIVETTDRRKQESLCSVLDETNPFMAIIFCRTKRRVDALEEALAIKGYNCDRLHGDIPQSKRERTMRSFKALKIQYLIATDVAARGLDVNGITHVFNYDIPENAESYIHRIGRTGRAGDEGYAYTFCAPRDVATMNRIESDIDMIIERIDMMPY